MIKRIAVAAIAIVWMLAVVVACFWFIVWVTR